MSSFIKATRQTQTPFVIMKIFTSLWISLGFLFSQETATGQENLALHQPCVQSSTSGTCYAQCAVDGFLDTYSHSNVQSDPWWRVDLQKAYRLDTIAVTNRVGSNYYLRLNGAVIRVGNFDDVYSNPVCAVISMIPPGATANFSCGGMLGRYVVVHLVGDLKILTLCEVQVYEYSGDNLAFDGSATQSSTFSYLSAEKAIDGDRGAENSTGCCSTLNETDPWWRLDLGHYYSVNSIVITNREDCCVELINGAEIRIGNSLENNGNDNPICAVIPAGRPVSFWCDGMEGRYVNVIIPGQTKSLTMCELEVYGEGPVVERSFLKLRFQSGADLTDPSIGENVLKQLGSALANKGLSNVTLRWSQTPKPVKQHVYTGPGVCIKIN